MNPFKKCICGKRGHSTCPCLDFPGTKSFGHCPKYWGCVLPEKGIPKAVVVRR